LIAQGTLGRFWFWTFEYAKEYVSIVSPPQALALFGETVSDITKMNVSIWIMAVFGVALLWTAQWRSETRISLTALLIASLLAVCPGFYFREHYFILLLPATALLCGVAVTSIQRLVARFTSLRIARIIASGVFILVIGAYVTRERNYLFSMSVRELSRARYGSDPFVEAPELARYIEAHTAPRDRIAVLGSEPEIYFYANRKSATGYIYTYPLMEQQKYSQRMQDEMIDEITAVHPKYILYVAVPTSWLPQSSSEKIISWSMAYLNQCYSRVGITEIVSKDVTRWFWDTDISKYDPQSEYVLYMYKANSEGPCRVPA